MLGFRVTEEKRQKYKHCSQELLGVLAANIISLRREQGLSQEALAEKSGMHRTFISLIERRGRNITLGAVEALAEKIKRMAQGPMECRLSRLLPIHIAGFN